MRLGRLAKEIAIPPGDHVRPAVARGETHDLHARRAVPLHLVLGHYRLRQGLTPCSSATPPARLPWEADLRPRASEDEREQPDDDEQAD